MPHGHRPRRNHRMRLSHPRVEHLRKEPGRFAGAGADLIKTDASQSSIAAALRAIGCSVEHIASATGRPGIPDLLVGRHGVNYLLECKVTVGKRNPRPAALSPGQVAWHGAWRGM